MPWLAIPYEEEAARVRLASLYAIRGIPSLILLNNDGSLITEDGRGEITDDPKAMVNFLKAEFVSFITYYYSVL